MPDMHLEVLVDLVAQEVRLVIVNHGGPAREVRVMGVLGDFGWAGIVPPTSYWQPGEERTVVVSMPPITADTNHAFVEARDLGKRHVLVATTGGATYRWPLRKAKTLSAQKAWERLFPGIPGPLDVPHTPMHMDTVERRLFGGRG